ncbi:hypothetical protein FUAX_53730 (plasmid) [Fulvitalea axinellae]|uniref:DUF5689 domain-containing protein n=1 Tax=Fulvitalea axinellae TaxID=1182444 RepID=A0AAU9DII1_9BACT|nr:hypothetical protein FUAX_53730 [Fulvitalea axinellae]
MRKFLIALVALATFFGCDSDNENLEPEPVENAGTAEVLPENETVHEGDVIIKSQADLDNFAKGKYTYVKGSVIIDGECGNDSGANHFKELQSIKKIEGHLAFLIVHRDIETIVGFNELVEIGHDFVVNNAITRTIDGFNKLTKIGGCMVIRDKVSTFKGFAQLAELGVGVNNKDAGIFDYGKDYEGKTLHVNLNSGSPRRGLSILKNIKSYEGSIYVKNVADLSFLDGIKHVKGDFYIQTNPVNKKIYIEDLSPLSELEKVDGNFSLDLGPKVTNLDALSKFTEVKSIRVEGSDQLADISGLENLAEKMVSDGSGDESFTLTLEYETEAGQKRKMTITKELLLAEGGKTAKYLDGAMPKMEVVSVSNQVKAGEDLTITFKTSSFYDLRYYIVNINPVSKSDLPEGRYYLDCSDNSLREAQSYGGTTMPGIAEMKEASITYKIPTTFDGKKAMAGKYKVRLGIYEELGAYHIDNYNSRDLEFEIID